MVQLVTPPLQAELPREFLACLTPRLRELYSQLPSALASRISDLVSEALPFGIHPDRVLKFAYLYATAERLAQGNAISKDHTRRSRLELAGVIHGWEEGYGDDGEATRRYRRGRRARQQIQTSFEALLKTWRAFVRVVEKHRSELPVHLRSRVSKAILEAGKPFQKLGIAIVLDEADLASERVGERERSEITQTYIWWRLKLARYRGQWNDMHQLAYAWHMTPTESVKRFVTVVNRICKGATCTHVFGNTWESALSEK
jgi:hypothetical protein